MNAQSSLPVSAPSGGRQVKLTDMQEAFVDLIVSGKHSPEQAAIEAGYSQATARVQAYELMQKPHVLQAVMERSAVRIVMHAPHAITCLQGLLNAKSDYVKLEAAKDILDRSGFKPTEKHDHRIAGDISVNIDLG